MAGLQIREIETRITKHKEQNAQLALAMEVLGDVAALMEGMDEAEKVLFISCIMPR
jgi:hypothetical protein